MDWNLVCDQQWMRATAQVMVWRIQQISKKQQKRLGLESWID
jgi:hypothetical protein